MRRSILLVPLVIVGAIAATLRFSQGLGASTHLTDQNPWGLWIAFDVLCGVALAAGGFTTAAAAHVFGGRRFRPLVRPAILTALLGYVFVSIGLVVDLGLPWHIWHPIVYWSRHSALFEVAWCVILYTSILALEFAPSVLERPGLERAHRLFRRLVPAYTVVALTFFTYVMSRSIPWTIAALAVLTSLALNVPRLFASRPGVPLVAIIAGVVFSIAHQSSLGSLFLIMPGRLSTLWYSPLLPLHFLVSAVAAGFAMVILESILSSRSLGRPLEIDALSGLGWLCAAALWIALGLRILDTAVTGSLLAASQHRSLFALEIVVGLLVPALVLSLRSLRTRPDTLLAAASLVVAGIVLNRFDVTIGAQSPAVIGAAPTSYFPSVTEILVTLGIVSSIVFLYATIARFLPVFEKSRST